jgi:tetratricopeptide (TPR) repeat protein
MTMNLKKREIKRMRRRRTGLALIALCLLWLPAAAHEGVYEQIAQLTRRIRRDPQEPALYLKRGELFRLLKQWDSALADYDRAATLAPTSVEVEFFRGRMWAEADQPRRARAALDRFLRAKPADVEGRLTRARLFARQHLTAAAVADYSQVIDSSPTPKPDHFIERARVQTAAREFAAALRGLDEGLAKLGPIVTLQVEAIEIELKNRNPDGALARLDAAAAASPRQEHWLARRGEILLRAGRKAEAKTAFTAALAAIEALPLHLRQVKATITLEKKVRAALS